MKRYNRAQAKRLTVAIMENEEFATRQVEIEEVKKSRLAQKVNGFTLDPRLTNGMLKSSFLLGLRNRRKK